MGKSNTPDSELSDYNLFCRYASLHGLRIKAAAELWKSRIKENYSSRNEMIERLIEILREKNLEYEIKNEKEESFKNFVNEGEEYRSEMIRRTRDRAIVKRRLEIDGYVCQNCKYPESFETLFKEEILVEVHHKHLIQDGERETKIDDLVTLCPNCHRLIHVLGRKEQLKFLDINVLKNLSANNCLQGHFTRGSRGQRAPDA